MLSNSSEAPAVNSLTSGRYRHQTSCYNGKAYGPNLGHRILAADTCDVITPNVVGVYGITPFMRIAELARAFGVPVHPHLPTVPYAEVAEDSLARASGQQTRWSL